MPRTTIGDLEKGQYFIPIGEKDVYRFNGYDNEWCLWIGVNDKDGSIVMFDDLPCQLIPALYTYEIQGLDNKSKKFHFRSNERCITKSIALNLARGKRVELNAKFSIIVIRENGKILRIEIVDEVLD